MNEILQWVDEVPPAKTGRGVSKWRPIVDQLLANPNRSALVFEGETRAKAEQARNNILQHAKLRNVNVRCLVRENRVYAVHYTSEK